MSIRDCVSRSIWEYENLYGSVPSYIEMSHSAFYDLVHEPGGKDPLTINDAAVVDGVTIFPSFRPDRGWDFLLNGEKAYFVQVDFPDMAADAAEIYLTLRADGMSPLTAKATAERLAA